ncbi:MAG: UDP-N-acetylglucosamine diphosphorylase/glucosamine-1-phosphate N-acetyltransferase [Gammaproteobacteria bacterium RIFCSPHIGHO2_02_FULL_42_13]|nr:MAG: UDP-N-acetylglucosamine diphosphorylase/glucosamine-1-phosphate N-acetyltransferase [Gammaproteobacteria bacterium RIFCSPHIGHO2_02_FULL_42_13]OGT68484.1 MAG: UDP-N-acetylglucosamine diphosphorylase/glucosamine-1-phosphate N-acetyltransferase [Gammaproteobacteria bacterium RIFCSPLOWO2_02_FULL_42_9]
MSLNIVILAAGQGKRMHSNLPKVLHCLGGKTLLEHVVDAVASIEKDKIYVVYSDNVVPEKLSHLSVSWVKQEKPLGTAHAVHQVLPELDENSHALVLCGDVPLITANTVQRLIDRTAEDAVGCLTAMIKYPSGFGRVIRGARGQLQSIVEERDATDRQRKIREVNAGIYIVPVRYLKQWLPSLKAHNAQNEYYFTDIIASAIEDQVTVQTTYAGSVMEIQGINDLDQLSRLERYWQRENSRCYMQAGLTLKDPERFDVRGIFEFGRDTTVDVNVIIEGVVKVGANCLIGSNVVLRNVTLGNHVEVKPNSIIEEATIADHCTIGPFARVRPGTQLDENVRIGNFVELKKAEVHEGSKISHLSYIGDAMIGKNVNIGAGTITCNYDGANKHRTVIGDNAFIGSDSQFIAPVTVGENATIGAGSTITQDAPADKLTVARSKQVTIEGWKRPEKD